MEWSPLLQGLTAAAALGAVYLNWVAYRGGSMDRLQKAADFLAKLQHMPANVRPLMEARFYGLMRPQLTFGWGKGLAFVGLWLVASIVTLIIGVTKERPVDLFIVGLAFLVLMGLNFYELTELPKSPQALARNELAEREKAAYFRFLGKPEQPPTEPPKWALTMQSRISRFVAHHKTGIRWAFALLVLTWVVFLGLTYFGYA